MNGVPARRLEATPVARPCKSDVPATGLSSTAKQPPQCSPAGHRCSQGEARPQPVLPAERACSCGSSAEQGCAGSLQDLLEAGCPAAADVGCGRRLNPCLGGMQPCCDLWCCLSTRGGRSTSAGLLGIDRWLSLCLRGVPRSRSGRFRSCSSHWRRCPASAGLLGADRLALSVHLPGSLLHGACLLEAKVRGRRMCASCICRAADRGQRRVRGVRAVQRCQQRDHAQQASRAPARPPVRPVEDPALEFWAGIQPESRHHRVRRAGEQADCFLSAPGGVAGLTCTQAHLQPNLDMSVQVHRSHMGSAGLSSRSSAAGQGALKSGESSRHSWQQQARGC